MIGFADRVTVEMGDAAQMPYEDQSLDLIVSKEAISHYRDVDAFVGETARVLCPGGALLIVDGNNGANPTIVRETRRVWRAFEIGDTTAREHEPREQPYRARRIEIAGTYAPELDAEMVADRTFGMNKAEIEAACDMLRKGSYAGTPYDPEMVPLDPDTDAVIERLFDPRRLGRQIREAGFMVKVSGYWGGAGGKRTVRLANRILVFGSRFTIWSAPAFVIAARKR